MKLSLLISTVTTVLFASTLSTAFAENVSHKKAVVTVAAAPAAKVPLSSDVGDIDTEPDISGTTSLSLSCEMGRNVRIYKHELDDQHIAILWKNRLNRLTRVSTSTGAGRFENKKMGLLWIDIPAKGMLLDTKNGKQLANECIYSSNNSVEKTKKG